MNNKTIILVFLFLGAISCNNRQDDLRRRPTTCGHYDSTRVQHQICYDSVLILMNNFYSQNTLREVADKSFIGGYFSFNTINKIFGYKDNKSFIENPAELSNYTVAKFFVCYKETFLGKNQFFLALEDSSTYNPNINCCYCNIDDDKKVTFPSEMFTIEKSISKEEIDTFLRRQDGKTENENDSIKGKKVKDYGFDFLRNFQVNGGATNVEICGAFNFNEFQSLLDQGDSVAGIRYYLGYDSIAHPRNKVRIILIGVDTDGRNILVNPNNPDQEAKFLEKSWPPF